MCGGWAVPHLFPRPSLQYSRLTDALYFVQLERRRGSDGSGSSSTSLQNLDKDRCFIRRRVAKKGKVFLNNAPMHLVT